MTQTMDRGGSVERFSLLGGPLHRLGRRLGLVRGDSDTLRLGLALGALAWTILMVLAAIGGSAGDFLSLSAIGVHVRTLVVIPLFFLCESWVDPEVRAFVGLTVRSGVVPRAEVPALDSAIARVTRLKDSWLPDALCLATAVLLPWIAGALGLVGAAEARAASLGFTQGTLSGWWALNVGLPLFRFLLFRWLFRLGLWWYFAWRMARLDLNLVPTHPDGVAGLGYLEVVHAHFTPLIATLSLVQSAMIADSVREGTITIASMTPSLSWILVVDGVLFLGPLLLFSPGLWACRRKGLQDYMALASRYVTGVDRTWVHADAPPGEPLQGMTDVQSLTDLAGTMDLVRTMRTAPVTLRLVLIYLAAAVLPLLPLALFEYPASELIRDLFRSLLGL